MGKTFTEKRKIVNDPVYGFIDMPSGLAYQLVEHRYFQRLRRIKQLGLTYYVYPGALHTRFQHALGANFLINSAIGVLKSKGHSITEEEARATSIAILLHDIGHGPFSHALENVIAEGLSHERLSMYFMEELNNQFNNELRLAIDIFKNKCQKKFLHQLVSSQLDTDRLDYLRRDSFFTGVSEGVVGSDRIIKMLNVVDDTLVVESKGIYSIEKFLIARRLMYWQVYLHKTVLSAEQLLVRILKRAKYLALNGEKLFCTPPFHYFLFSNIKVCDFSKEVLDNFALLDDYDVVSAVKVWTNHPDPILSTLCRSLINRRLLKIQIQKQPFSESQLYEIKKEIIQKMRIKPEDADYFVFVGEITNNAYNSGDDKINILYNNGDIIDIADASDMLNISVLSKVVKKYYMCYFKI